MGMVGKNSGTEKSTTFTESKFDSQLFQLYIGVHEEDLPLFMKVILEAGGSRRATLSGYENNSNSYAEGKAT